MPRKYEKLDIALLTWLSTNRKEVTTARAVQALGIACTTTERHVSRRFTQLEDRGVLVCTLKGTTRICAVALDPPSTLARQRWRPKHAEPLSIEPVTAIRGIPAIDSNAFELAGGLVEKIACHWDRPITQAPLGALTFQDYLSTLD